MACASEAGGELTGRSWWAPRVREDGHARVWIEKRYGVRTHARERETCMIPRERERERRVVFVCVCVCARHGVRERGELRSTELSVTYSTAQSRGLTSVEKERDGGAERDTKRQIGSRPAKFLESIH